MHALLDIVLTLSSTLVLGSFAWAMKAHFVTARIPTGAKVISALASIGFLVVLHQLWILEQPVWAQLAGLLVHGLSLALFAWAIGASRAARLTYAFEKDEPQMLLRRGPYRVIRHPFYTSYILFWAGSSLATLSPLCAVLALALAALFTTAARAEEGKFRQSSLSADYEAYRRQAGLFWPRWARAE